jgi:hypothetical protein
MNDNFFKEVFMFVSTICFVRFASNIIDMSTADIRLLAVSVYLALRVASWGK